MVHLTQAEISYFYFIEFSQDLMIHLTEVEIGYFYFIGFKSPRAAVANGS
jgi:hypothetical protein